MGGPNLEGEGSWRPRALRSTRAGGLPATNATRGRLQDCHCTDGDACEHVRTRKDSHHPGVPYQTDYLFASKKMAACLVSCEALVTEEWFAISDHAPIVADFEL